MEVQLNAGDFGKEGVPKITWSITSFFYLEATVEDFNLTPANNAITVFEGKSVLANRPSPA